jgi:hypothetical protein
MTTRPLPYLILDIDEVLQASHMSYGHEMTRTIEQLVPWEQVHPLNRPRQQASRRSGKHPTFVHFRTKVRVSPKLLEDLSLLPAQVVMLTSWLEDEAAYTFLEQATPGGRWFPTARHLRFPGRAEDGSLSWSWKWNLLQELLAEDPRPFIWADDDEVPKWRHEVEHSYPTLPHLLLAPKRHMGLTREDTKKMAAFIASLPKSEVSHGA